MVQISVKLPIVLVVISNFLMQIVPLPIQRLDAYTRKILNSQHQNLQLHFWSKPSPPLPPPPVDFKFPTAILVAGFNITQLESLDNVLFTVFPALPPVIVLGENQRNIMLRDVLISDGDISERDHSLPNKFLAVEVPVILLSGIDREDAFSLMKRFKDISMSPESSTLLPTIAFAVAVLPALSKTLGQLLGEILSDHVEFQSLKEAKLV